MIDVMIYSGLYSSRASKIWRRDLHPGYSTATDTRRERVFCCRKHTHI
ncbi:hypothetical protein AC83_2549 [Escherichia coli 1-250-04_S4_C1]|nr:hypothetical protein AD11_2436 [Escherichia coli 1-250-04_S4_C2]EZJ54025.1 hypothetical protein AC83_2549 [Escherichia coli 1-250-04_S4_C1]